MAYRGYPSSPGRRMDVGDDDDILPPKRREVVGDDMPPLVVDDDDDDRKPAAVIDDKTTIEAQKPPSPRKKKKKKNSGHSTDGITSNSTPKSKSPRKGKKIKKKPEGTDGGDGLPASLPLVGSMSADSSQDRINHSSERGISPPLSPSALTQDLTGISPKTKKKKKKEKTGSSNDGASPKKLKASSNSPKKNNKLKSPGGKKKPKITNAIGGLPLVNEENSNDIYNSEVSQQAAKPASGKKKQTRTQGNHTTQQQHDEEVVPKKPRSAKGRKKGTDKSPPNSPKKGQTGDNAARATTNSPKNKGAKLKSPNGKKEKPVSLNKDAPSLPAAPPLEQHVDDAQRHIDSQTSNNVYVASSAHQDRNLEIRGGTDQEVAMDETVVSSLPDVLLLSRYCTDAHAPLNVSEEARQQADASWDPAREWIGTRSSEEATVAARQIDEQGVTVLHQACRNSPPEDMVSFLLKVARESVECQDAFGWLPIHYACASLTETRVLKLLVEAFPDSRNIADRRGRTPLHFALGNSNPDNPVSPETVILLSSSVAIRHADDGGMLPLHYACAYGASEDCIRVLTDRYSAAITTKDNFGRTPLHFALSNAGRGTAPAAVRLLLSLRPQIVDAKPGTPLPLRFLAEYASSLGKHMDKERDAVRRCLDLLLSHDPNPTADFFTALQSLPDWLREVAVVVPAVQVLLNEKISQRFPTGLLLADFFVQVIVIICYAYVVPVAIDRRFDDTNDEEFGMAIEARRLVPLYLGGLYFFVRATVQVLSLLALGAFRIWLLNPSSWLDITYIFVLFYWSTRMLYGPPEDESGSNEDRESFRTGTALSVMVIWAKLLAYLRTTYVDFAVFLGGLFYVARRLVAFLLCLCIILVAFSQMFFTIYRQSDPRCTDQPNDRLTDDELITNLQCEDNKIEVYCDRWSAFLNCYTMLLGEVDETQFSDSTFATILFVLFMFLVVILLANVLIAVVTDSYKIIRDQRAAIVFWTNRLYFIAEMDAIANGPWRNRARELFGLPLKEQRARMQITFGRAEWDQLMSMVYDYYTYDEMGPVEVFCANLFRVSVAVFAVPLWLLIGLLSFGLLWPPQVREAFFTSTVLQHSSDSEEQKALRTAQVKILKAEVGSFKDDLKQEMAIDRTHMVQMKSLVAEKKLEMQSEMKRIKRIVAMLFEQRS